MKKNRKSFLAFFLVAVMLITSSGIRVDAAVTEKPSITESAGETEKKQLTEETGKIEGRPVSSKEILEQRIAANIRLKEGKTRSVRISGYMISNDYIQCAIQSSGNFTIGTADGDCLLFDHPDGMTSQTLIRIDERDYIFDDLITDITKISNEKCVITAKVDDVEVQQILQIENNPSTTRKDLISIQYQCTNRSTEKKNIGIRIMMDTMLGENDGSPFKINGDPVTREREYRGEGIPKIFQAMNSLKDPNIVATGYLYYNQAERPDKVQFASWTDIHDSDWEYVVNTSQTILHDSALAVYFDEEPLAAQKTKTVVTRYGVYNADSAGGYDHFTQDNTTYSHQLALQLASYAALAYEDYQYVGAVDSFYAVNHAEYFRLKDRLNQDGFSYFKKYNYDHPTENGATFNIASKKVNYHGEPRDLVVVSIRGTNQIQWKGNMNVAEGGENGPYGDTESYSFRAGKNEIKEKLKEYCLNRKINGENKPIRNALIWITGHSRGGAIGNLLAADLTKRGLGDNFIDQNSVYAYLFAVPNCTSNADTSMNNIYNFCFTDDFVPSVPLKNHWNFDKNGITFTKSAQSLYKNHAGFREKAYKASRLSAQRDPSFQLMKCRDLIRYIENNWGSVEEYYTKKVKFSGNNTLYKYMHNVIAPAAMANWVAAIKLVAGQTAGKYQKIADYFVDGFHQAYNVNDNHQMYTYYAALTSNCFITAGAARKMEEVDKGARTNVTNQRMAATAANEKELAALKKFAEQEANAAILGWDFETGSFPGVTFDETSNCVTEINLEYPEEDEAGNRQYLKGSLDLSSFKALTKIMVAGNALAELILPSAEVSVLQHLDCSHNSLSHLDVRNQPLLYVNAAYNYLDQDSLNQLAALASSGEVEIAAQTQRIPDNANFSQEEFGKLQTLFADTEVDDGLASGSWPGVIWEKNNETYYVTRLELSGSGLKGAADLSGFHHLEYLDCSANALSSLDVSDCENLTTVQCCDNVLTSLITANTTSLENLYCSGNKLSMEALDRLPVKDRETGWQGVNAGLADFAKEEYEVLLSFASSMSWPEEKPGDWKEIQWKKEADGKYHVISMDLSAQENLTGSLDLSVFSSLERFKLYGSGFSSVILPTSIETIPEQAFFGCKNLKEITVSSQLKEIGKEAFRECSALEEIFLPSTVTAIGDGAFRCCTSLNGIYFTGNAPSFGKDVFLNVGPSFTIYFLNGTTGFEGEYFQNYIHQSVDKLSVYRMPDKSSYILGETLDLSGLVLLQLAEDGSHQRITEGYAYNPITFEEAGNKTIPVSHNGQQVTIDVSVRYPYIDLILPTDYIEMGVNSSEYLTIAVEGDVPPSDILKKNIQWESEDSSRVTVEPDGQDPFQVKITAHAIGECCVKAKLFDRVALIYCDVYEPVTDLKLESCTVNPYQWKDISYTVKPETAAESLKWSSSDESVAEVSDGQVYGVTPGVCTITARAGDFSASMQLTVAIQAEQTVYAAEAKQLDSNTKQNGRGYENDMSKCWIYHVPEAKSITMHLSRDCVMEDYYDYLLLTDKKDNLLYKWTGREMADKTVTVSGDTVKIYMYTDGSNSDYYGFKVDKVNVEKGISHAGVNPDSSPITVSGIRLKGISHNVSAGKKITLHASVIPETAVNKNIVWSSSNPKVAAVNQRGVVTLKKKTGGKSAVITAAASDGSGVVATWKIKSMKGVVKKVTIHGAKTVKAGKKLKLRAKVTATKGANKKLQWTSSNPKYAVVSSSGKIKTMKAGKGKKVKITAMATDGSNKKKTVTIKIK